jgi:tRNA A37 N6-isopentenylltransferase MiaA
MDERSESHEPRVPAPDKTDLELEDLSNAALLASLDILLLELERRLLHYARTGHEIEAMADEGLVLAVKAAARLRQAQSSAMHTTGHLQVVGVGEWTPQSTNPGWSDDPRVTGSEDEPHEH